MNMTKRAAILSKLVSVNEQLLRIKFSLFGKEFKVGCFLDKKYGNRLYIQVQYKDECRVTGKVETWHGKKCYLSDHMTTDEIIKTAYGACKAAVDHEVMEGFTVDGIVLFNPHIHFEELLKVSHLEVRRHDNRQ